MSLDLCTCSVAAAALIAGALALLLVQSRRVTKHLGVYTRPGPFYALKYAAFYALLRLRKVRGGGSGGGGGGGGSSGYGRKSRSSELDMERTQPLSQHPQAIDAAYFNGYSRDGSWYLGAGIQRRHHSKAECIMVVRPPAGLLDTDDSGDILEWPWGPATDVDSVGDDWSAGGLTYETVEPMREWRVAFSGQLRQRRGRQLRQVAFDLTWRASTPVFDFDTDMDARPTCAAIAAEPWSGDFFKRLREAHQTHYEQFGKLKGEIRIEGVGRWPLELDSMRDRSYGLYRRWGDFHRYILQYFVLEDSTCIAFHLVCLPVLMSHLITGFVITPDKQKLAATGSSLALWQLGEGEPPPSSYSLELTVQGGLRYGLQVRAVEAPFYYCGWNWEAKLYCVLADVRCRMPDGGQLAGRGMCEFEYQQAGGRTDGRVPVPTAQ